MKKINKIKVESEVKKLTDVQVVTVRHYIIESMRGAYINSGNLPPSNFDILSLNVASNIIDKVQESLSKGVEVTKPIKKISKKK